MFARGSLVITVFAPDPHEYELLEQDKVVFGFWGLPAARPEDFRALMAREVTAIGIEAIEDDEGHAPVRHSMSEIAGGLAVIVGSSLLLNEFGGKGILLGGVPGVPPGSFVILGAGVLGRTAARAALGLGAQVTLLDDSVAHLRAAARRTCPAASRRCSRRSRTSRRRSPSPTSCWAPWPCAASAPPMLVTREMLRLMKPRIGGDGPRDRHGRLLRDLASDLAREPDATRWTASCTCASRTCRRARRAPRRRR